jgi:uncharacterized protein YeaO (DUF488 family)
MKQQYKTKRIYEAPSDTDGCRILIDRLWPRGLSKAEVAINEWDKDLAPSSELRKWFGHDVDSWAEFQRRYKDELKRNDAVGSFLNKHQHEKLITLLYAAKDEEHNNAIVLKSFLEGKQ